MIKFMEGENVSIRIDGSGKITLKVNDMVAILDADSFEELRGLADHFWNANDLYRHTSEAKEERKRYEGMNLLTPNGGINAPLAHT